CAHFEYTNFGPFDFW
nr:immunoglobulin heavy chain junction region [Macaca mulatta]